MKFNRRNKAANIAVGATMASCRSFDGSPRAKGLLGATLSIATLTASLAASPALHAQSPSLSFAGVQSTVPTQGLGKPTALTVDGSGNLFIADNDNHRILEISPAGVQTTLNIPAKANSNIPGGPFPQVVDVVQLSVDNAGNLFILDDGTSTGYYITNPQVKEYSTSGVLTTLLTQGLGNAQGLTVDHAEHVIANNPYENAAFWFPYSTNLGGGGQINPGQSLEDPFNMAMGPYNPATNTQYLFIADAGDGAIDSGVIYAVKESFSSSGSPSFDWTNRATLEMPWGNPTKNITGVAADYAGNVFATDSGNNRVIEWPITSANASGADSFGSGVVLPISGLSNPYGVAVDGKGNLYVADQNNSRVVEMQLHSVNFGAVNVCPVGQASPAPCSNTIPVTFNVTASGTLSSPQIFTQGLQWTPSARNAEFAMAPGSTCKASVTAGSTCTVNVTFNPKYPGLRSGSVQMMDSSGNIVATVPIYGYGEAPLVAFSQAAQSNLRLNYSMPNPISAVVDAGGNIFVAETSGTLNPTGTVVKFIGGSSEQVIATGLSGGLTLAVDGEDNLYIADAINNKVLKVTPKLVQTTIGTGLNYPAGVAVDGEGNVFISDGANNRVVEVPVAGPQFTAVSGLNSPNGVAVDGLGNIYVADTGNRRVLEVSASGTQTSYGTGLVWPINLTVDAGGDIYVVDPDLGQVLEINPSGQQSTVATGVTEPFNISLDGAGDLFIVDGVTSRIREVQQSQPPSFNFGSLSVSESSAPLSVTVQNIGNQPLNASGLSVSGTNFEQVEYTTPLQDCWSYISLPGGANCNLSVIFWPPSTGSFTGSAVLTDNTSNSSSALQTIRLSGTGTP